MRAWGRAYSVQRSWLGNLGVALLALGVALFIPSLTTAKWAQFSAPGYHWVFAIIPRLAWAFIMVICGVLMLLAATTRSDDDWRYWAATAMSVAIPSMWAAAFLAAPFTGYNSGVSGAIVWTLIAGWSIHLTRRRG